MRQLPAALLAISFALASGGAAAGEIYKWTDEDGNVHYGDRPTTTAPIERVAVASQATDSAAVTARRQAHNESQLNRAEAKAKRAEEKQAAAEARAEEEKRVQQCESLRARMESYLQAPRLYREDESGERVYLDDEQILAARANLQDKIQETCK